MARKITEKYFLVNYCTFKWIYFYVSMMNWKIISCICNHEYPSADEVITGVYLEHSHPIQKRDLSETLQIKLYYDESVYRLPDEKFTMIHEHILPDAVKYWQQALRIRKKEKIIRLNRRCAKNQVFLLRDDPHPYCKGFCEPETMCGEVVVPEEHLNECRVCNSLGHNCHSKGPAVGKGIPGADFIFYISALETDRCKKGFTVAYAAHCQQEATLDRPIAGHANLCPSSISLKEQEVKTLLSTVKHEILHALGFSVSLYAFYRDDEGRPLTNRTENGKPILNEQLQARQWSDQVIKTIVRPNWEVRKGYIEKEINMIVTPKVVEEVRQHFQCSELEGAELEDQGHEGTALTHWEKRMFENEAMTGTHTQNPVYSRITLALMEDTGWYHANYEMAQPLKWGKGLGCDFAMKSCRHWIKTKSSEGKSIHPYCNKVKRNPLETECTEDRSSVALCNLIEYPNPLPPHYQNFESIPHVNSESLAHFGGSVSLADYCPYIQEFTWKSQNIVIRGSHCQFPENNPDTERNFALENYSSHSLCFNHKVPWSERTCSQARQWQHWGSGCYSFTCSEERIHITVANYTYTCRYTNQVISIKIYQNNWLHEGVLICPACSEVCTNSSMCNQDMEQAESITYQEDELVCSSCRLSFNYRLSIMVMSFYLLNSQT